MSAAVQAPPLWQLLQHTAAAAQATLAGKSLTAQLEAVPSVLRPGVQALSFQVMRQLGRARALRALLASRKPPPAWMRCCARPWHWAGMKRRRLIRATPW